MRLIPGKTKVKIELFKGVTLGDVIIGGIGGLLLVLIVVSSLPHKIYFAVGLLAIVAALLFRLNSEPTYKYVIHVLKHFAYPRRYTRLCDDELLVMRYAEDGQEQMANLLFRKKKQKEEEEKAGETAEEVEPAQGAEPEEITKEAESSKGFFKKNTKKSGGGYDSTAKSKDMQDIIAFTGISKNLIEYGGSYYGAVLEIPPLEFRFFSEHRRNMSIENGLGRVLRSISPNYCANIVKLERPVQYSSYLDQEYDKLDRLKESYEKGMLTEEELKARVEVLYDRLNELNDMCTTDKVVAPFYYLVLYDSDRHQLEMEVSNAIESLQAGEMDPHRLNDKELAIFLKYSNQMDFDETDIDKIPPEAYAEWAMPQSVDIKMRSVEVNHIITHNFCIMGYPAIVGDAWLAGVMSLSATKCVVKCKPMDRSKAIRAIDRSLQELRGQYMATNVDSKQIELQTHIDTLSELLVMLNQDNESLLEVNVYVTAYDMMRTEELYQAKYPESALVHIANMKKLVRRIYQENGMRLHNMDFEQVQAFIGSQVSGYDPLAKEGRGIPSNTVAACYPWIFDHVSDAGGIHLGNNEGVPVFIDFFRRDSERINSNMVIMGKSGSGKSYATKSLLTNLAADDCKIFILDPENEYTELANNLHGKFINVGNAQYGRLNPFQIITSMDDEDGDEDTVSGSYATHLQFLEEFFRQILPDCDKDAMEYLNSLIDRMYLNHGITMDTDLSKLRPEDYPIFDDLYDEILEEFQQTDNEYIRSILRVLMNYIAKFSTGGRNANIWNGPSTITTDENFTVFNFQSLLANRNGTIANAQMLLVLKYIDNEIIKNRDYNTRYHLNRKIVVVIDEAHVFIDTKFPVALDFMFQLAKRIRKYNGMQIVITQNIKDFVGSEEIARKSTAIINACQYSFIFALSPNDMDDLCTLYAKSGGINESEQEQITTAPRGQAFTVMSPTSRTNFRVEVPEDVVEMFSEQEYVSKYFAGEAGAEIWEDFIGDSREKRAVYMEENGIKEPEEQIPLEEETKSQVTFIELDEAEEELGQNVSDIMNEMQGTGGKVSFEEADVKPGSVLFEEAEEETREESGSVLFEEVEEEPEEESGSVLFEEDKEEPEQRKQEMPQTSAESSENSSLSEVQNLLNGLLGRFSYEAILQEIKRAVKDELQSELEGKNLVPAQTAAQAAPSEEESYDGLFGQDTGGSDDEEDDIYAGFFGTDEEDESMASGFFGDEEEEERQEDESMESGFFGDEEEEERQEDESMASGFFEDEDEEEEEGEKDVEDETDEELADDFMRLFAEQEEIEKNILPFDVMVEDNIDVMDVTLEELTQYNNRLLYGKKEEDELL